MRNKLSDYSGPIKPVDLLLFVRLICRQPEIYGHNDTPASCSQISVGLLSDVVTAKRHIWPSKATTVVYCILYSAKYCE